jgi:hypothetical protein
MGGGLGFGMYRIRKGRARNGATEARAGLEGATVFGDRRWNQMEADG